MPNNLEKINWAKIDTILLDMDGTILDLSFDDYIWNKKVPENLAKVKNLELDEAQSILRQKMTTVKSTLNWYSFKYWEDSLNINIDVIEEKFKHKIKFRNDALLFLKSNLVRTRQPILVTNADRKGLNRKLRATGLERYFQNIVCSHDLKHAKEERIFWDVLRTTFNLNYSRTLLIDDNIQVLDVARDIGIKYLRGISRPNSKREPIESDNYLLINKLREILY